MFPVIAFFLLNGGLGLESVSTNKWGGLLVTLVLGCTGIALAFPLGIILALGVTWGMTSQRISAMEQDVDRMEQALVTFTKMEVRLAVIEAELKNINKKLDN